MPALPDATNPLAKDDKTRVFRIKLDQVNYCWRSTDKVYPPALREGLGIDVVGDDDNNLVFGADAPKPVRVRVNLADGRSLMRFCDPGKLEDVENKGVLNDKSVGGVFGSVAINSVRSIRS